MLRLNKAENRPKNPPSIFSLDYFSKNGRKKVSENYKIVLRKETSWESFPICRIIRKSIGKDQHMMFPRSNKKEDSYQVSIFHIKKYSFEKERHHEP
jgi:hypothetical protein